ncbi:cobalt-precorrin-6A reductase [Microlunatus soli]|uniref:Precorrin-6A/cobalt-precorrin-6A reductase n=1 Tax=Microlunatus soli TaxID=630515 RepID=A0A1H1ZHE3_9ACTN|nr:cobalt-precorrin-6A reductase [Microlunatus soli]SDT32977.1 precorrin-6A/cobalt-precorrin-6A reductase [Microlunatus soli]
MTILILGGTAEARSLAAELTGAGRPVISSLAGRVGNPRLPTGPVRIGGFGGTAGLIDYLLATKISVVVDATHPFAAQMSDHAAQASRRTGIPLFRLVRPGWSDHPVAANWDWVPDLATAAEHGTGSRRPFITTGRQSLPAFGSWADRDALIRLVDVPTSPLPARWTVLRSRGPYDHDHERTIFEQHRPDLLVTKDSGGDHTVAKVEVAAELGVDVLIVARPPIPEDVATVDSVPRMIDLLSVR